MNGINRWTNSPLEEELYEKAHIDYNRVAIVRTVPNVDDNFSRHT